MSKRNPSFLDAGSFFAGPRAGGPRSVGRAGLRGGVQQVGPGGEEG